MSDRLLVRRHHRHGQLDVGQRRPELLEDETGEIVSLQLRLVIGEGWVHVEGHVVADLVREHHQVRPIGRGRRLQSSHPLGIVEDQPIPAAVLGRRLGVGDARRGSDLEVRHRDADRADDALHDGARLRTALGARNPARGRGAADRRQRASAKCMLARRLARGRGRQRESQRNDQCESAEYRHDSSPTRRGDAPSAIFRQYTTAPVQRQSPVAKIWLPRNDGGLRVRPTLTASDMLVGLDDFEQVERRFGGRDVCRTQLLGRPLGRMPSAVYRVTSVER